MRHILLMVILIAGVPLARTQARSGLKPPETQAVKELIDVERQLSDALVRYDIDTLDRLWSDDLIFTAPNGHMTTKPQRIASVKAAASSRDTSVASSTNDDVKVHVYEQAAVVTVHSTWKGQGKEGPFTQPYQATHVWVKQRGRWRLVAAHVTTVAVQ